MSIILNDRKNLRQLKPRNLNIIISTSNNWTFLAKLNPSKMKKKKKKALLNRIKKFKTQKQSFFILRFENDLQFSNFIELNDQVKQELDQPISKKRVNLEKQSKSEYMTKNQSFNIIPLTEPKEDFLQIKKRLIDEIQSLKLIFQDALQIDQLIVPETKVYLALRFIIKPISHGQNNQNQKTENQEEKYFLCFEALYFEQNPLIPILRQNDKNYEFYFKPQCDRVADLLNESQTSKEFDLFSLLLSMEDLLYTFENENKAKQELLKRINSQVLSQEITSSQNMLVNQDFEDEPHTKLKATNLKVYDYSADTVKQENSSQIFEKQKSFIKHSPQIHQHYDEEDFETFRNAMQPIQSGNDIQKMSDQKIPENSDSDDENSADDEDFGYEDDSEDEEDKDEAPMNYHQVSRFKQDYEVIKQIGSGGFGKVFKAKNKLDGNYYAIKQIELDDTDVKSNQRTMNEVLLLSRLHHQHIVRYYQAWVEYQKVRRRTDLCEEELSEKSNEEESKNKKNLGFNPFGKDDYQKETSQFSSNDIDEKFNEMGFDFAFVDNEEQQNKIESLSEDPSSSHKIPANKLVKRKYSTPDKSKQSVKQYLYISMELCKGKTLKSLIKANTLTQEMKRNIMRQILEALTYIHQKLYLHRDLKPQNIFLDDQLNVKLGDFGLATQMKKEIQFEKDQHQALEAAISRNLSRSISKDDFVSHGGQEIQQNPSFKNFENNLTQNIGTYMYLAPEQEETTSYDQKADIFSLGIIMFEMYYTFKTDMERFKILKNLKTDQTFPEDFSKRVGIDNQDIQQKIIRLIAKEPKKRPTAKEFLREYQDKQLQEIIFKIINKKSEYLKLLEILFDIRPNYDLKLQENRLIKNIIQEIGSLLESQSLNPDSVFQEYFQAQQKLQFVLKTIFNIYTGYQFDCSPFMLQDNNRRIMKLNRKIIQYTQDSQSPLFLSENGFYFQYASNLIQPYLHHINQLQLINTMRRYSFGEVCTRDQDNSEIQKRKKIASYDILWEQNYQNDLYIYHIGELMFLSVDILSFFQPNRQFIHRITHTNLLLCIIQELDLSEEFIIDCFKSTEFNQKVLWKYCLLDIQDENQSCLKLLTKKFNIKPLKAQRFLKLISIWDTNFQGFKNKILQNFKHEDNILQVLYELDILEQLRKFHQIDFDKEEQNHDYDCEYRTFLFSDLMTFYQGVCFEAVEKKIHTKKYQKVRSFTSSDKKYISRAEKQFLQPISVAGKYSHYIENNREGCGIQIQQDFLLQRSFESFLHAFKNKQQNFFNPLNLDKFQQLESSLTLNQGCQDWLIWSEISDEIDNLNYEKFALTSFLRKRKIPACFSGTNEKYQHSDWKVKNCLEIQLKEKDQQKIETIKEEIKIDTSKEIKLESSREVRKENKIQIDLKENKKRNVSIRDLSQKEREVSSVDNNSTTFRKILLKLKGKIMKPDGSFEDCPDLYNKIMRLVKESCPQMSRSLIYEE